jgi:hypothetical protein
MLVPENQEREYTSLTTRTKTKLIINREVPSMHNYICLRLMAKKEA